MSKYFRLSLGVLKTGIETHFLKFLNEHLTFTLIKISRSNETHVSTVHSKYLYLDIFNIRTCVMNPFGVSSSYNIDTID